MTGIVNLPSTSSLRHLACLCWGIYPGVGGPSRVRAPWQSLMATLSGSARTLRRFVL